MIALFFFKVTSYLTSVFVIPAVIIYWLSTATFSISSIRNVCLLPTRPFSSGVNDHNMLRGINQQSGLGFLHAHFFFKSAPPRMTSRRAQQGFNQSKHSASSDICWSAKIPFLCLVLASGWEIQRDFAFWTAEKVELICWMFLSRNACAWVGLSFSTIATWRALMRDCGN